MKAILSHIYLGILILLSLLQLKLAHAGDLEIQTFRLHVQNFEMADQDYQRAPGGSMQESQANLRRQEAAQAAKNIIRSPYAFTNMIALTNEQLFNEFSQQYQSAPGGSLREGIFDVARRAASEGLKVNAVLEIQSAWDYKQALQLTLTANQKYQNAPGGSILESVFDLVRRQGFVISKQKLQEYSQTQLQDFRQAEALFVYMEQQYQAAAGGSQIENFYQEGRQTIRGRTIELMQLSAPYMTLQQLLQIRDEYNSKYQNAAGGSLAESMYLAIRNEAQMRLQSAPAPMPQQPLPQQPMPMPQPPINTPVGQTPIPGAPTCEIHSGRNASGQTLFRVMDRAGRIIATVWTVQDAEQIAMSDMRCRM